MSPPTISEAFARVLQKERKAKGLSQEKLAERANLHTNHISLIERNKRKPSLEVAEAVSKALGKSLSEIIKEAESAQRGVK